jgi:hypothetical protein
VLAYEYDESILAFFSVYKLLSEWSEEMRSLSDVAEVNNIKHKYSLLSSHLIHIADKDDEVYVQQQHSQVYTHFHSLWDLSYHSEIEWETMYENECSLTNRNNAFS